MSETDRRRFLAVAGGGAAAGLGLAGMAGPADASSQGVEVDESVVAYVDDPTSDEVTLTVGEREVVVRDRDLVKRLLAAAAGGK